MSKKHTATVARVRNTKRLRRAESRKLLLETLDPRRVLAGMVDSIELTDDTGASDTDGITREAAVTGTASTTGSGSLTIEFDHYGDGTIDGSTAVTNGDFNYDPLANDQALATWDGSFDLAYRVKETDGSGVTYSSWQTLSMTLDRVGPTVSSSNPTENETIHDSQLVMSVVFDEPIDSSSVQAAQIYVENGGTQALSAPTSSSVDITLAAPLASGTYTTHLVDIADLAGNTLSESWDWHLNETPTHTLINDITVSQGTTSTILDLKQHFSDTEDATLTYNVVETTSSNLFSNVAVNDGVVTFDFAPNVTGTATFSLTAIDSNGAEVTTLIDVEVNAPPVILELKVTVTPDGSHMISGKIADERPELATVFFEGVFEGSTNVESDGEFKLTVDDLQTGELRAFAVDDMGQLSPIKIVFVIS